MNQAACSQFLFCCWSAVKPWASYFPSLCLSVTSQSCCEGGERMLEEHTASPGPGRAFREHSDPPKLFCTLTHFLPERPALRFMLQFACSLSAGSFSCAESFLFWGPLSPCLSYGAEGGGGAGGRGVISPSFLVLYPHFPSGKVCSAAQIEVRWLLREAHMHAGVKPALA